MKNIRLFILFISLMCFHRVCAFTIDGQESKQWILDYNTGEITEFEANSPEELITYIKENIKTEVSIINDDYGCILEIRTTKGAFYNCQIDMFGGKIYGELIGNQFYWSTNADVMASLWRVWKEYELEDFSYMLPAVVGEIHPFEGVTVNDLRFDIYSLDIISIPSYPLAPYPMPLPDGEYRKINFFNGHNFLKGTEAGNNFSEKEYIPSDLIKVLKNDYHENKNIITYLGQYIENPWQLRAVAHIKYRIDGAHYFPMQSEISDIKADIGQIGAIYDLYGREVKNVLPGNIYIRNGKKFIGK